MGKKVRSETKKVRSISSVNKISAYLHDIPAEIMFIAMALIFIVFKWSILELYAVHSREFIRELAVQDFLFKTTKKMESYLFFV